MKLTDEELHAWVEFFKLLAEIERDIAPEGINPDSSS